MCLPWTLSITDNFVIYQVWISSQLVEVQMLCEENRNWNWCIKSWFGWWEGDFLVGEFIRVQFFSWVQWSHEHIISVYSVKMRKFKMHLINKVVKNMSERWVLQPNEHSPFFFLLETWWFIHINRECFSESISNLKFNIDVLITLVLLIIYRFFHFFLNLKSLIQFLSENFFHL